MDHCALTKYFTHMDGYNSSLISGITLITSLFWWDVIIPNHSFSNLPVVNSSLSSVHLLPSLSGTCGPCFGHDYANPTSFICTMLLWSILLLSSILLLADPNKTKRRLDIKKMRSMFSFVLTRFLFKVIAPPPSSSICTTN